METTARAASSEERDGRIGIVQFRVDEEAPVAGNVGNAPALTGRSNKQVLEIATAVVLMYLFGVF